MYSKFAKFVRHFSLIEAGIVFLFGMYLLQLLIYSDLPVWAVTILFVLLLLSLSCGIAYIMMRRTAKLFQAEKQRLESLTLEDFQKMYVEYADIVEEQIRIKNYDRELINQKWLEDYHKLFYSASRMLDGTAFTDFHIAACMIFALVSKDDSLSHIRFVYDCITNLIYSPRVYHRSFGYAGMITLEVETRYLGADFENLEEYISADEICKIIKEVYIHNNDDDALIELANFLGRLYKRCRNIRKKD